MQEQIWDAKLQNYTQWVEVYTIKSFNIYSSYMPGTAQSTLKYFNLILTITL